MIDRMASYRIIQAKIFVITLFITLNIFCYAQPDSPDLTIERIFVDNIVRIKLSWSPVEEVNAYYIYNSHTPHPNNWGEAVVSLEADVTEYTFPINNKSKDFFMVTSFAIGGIPDSFVRVEGGTFNPTTNYTVTLSSFYISKFLLIQPEYQEIMGNNPSFYSEPHDEALRRPVEYVRWFDIIEFCNRLSVLEYLDPVYEYNGRPDPDDWYEQWDDWNEIPENYLNVTCNWNANGYRLPTEMEWEFAAKGGVIAQQSGTFNTAYSGSDNVDEVAWHNLNSNGTPQAIASKRPNELGIYDMSGNVWEWCWDSYAAYPAGHFIDPKGATVGSSRVFRGGCFAASPTQCKITSKVGNNAAYRYSYLGFRITRNAPD